MKIDGGKKIKNPLLILLRRGLQRKIE